MKPQGRIKLNLTVLAGMVLDGHALL